MAFLNWRCLLPRAPFSLPERIDAFRQRPVKAGIVSIMVAEVRVSRTHRRPMRTTAGFEDREGHRSPSTSAYDRLCHYHTNRGPLRKMNSSVTRLTRQSKAGGCASKLAPGSLRAALDSLSPQTDLNLLDGHVHGNARLLMYDPQTSSGLLVSVESGDADALVQALHEAGDPAQPIGHGIAGKPEIILRGDRS
jgi:hypothetical protein